MSENWENQPTPVEGPVSKQLDGSSVHKETGWIIEKGVAPLYYYGGIHWGVNAEGAIRFARKADAERTITCLLVVDGDERAVEHSWAFASDPTAPTETATSVRDKLGRVVREAWVRWAQEQHNPKPHWLTPYDELAETDKEADRRIGIAVGATVARDLYADGLTCGMELVAIHTKKHMVSPTARGFATDVRKLRRFLGLLDGLKDDCLSAMPMVRLGTWRELLGGPYDDRPL